MWRLIVWTDLETARIHREIDRAYEHQKKISAMVHEKAGPEVVANIGELHPAEWKRHEEIENLIATFPPEAKSMELIDEWAGIWSKIGRKYLWNVKKQGVRK
jgi:hypothetical protein